jgi:Domain of unknown function (DUF4160)
MPHVRGFFGPYRVYFMSLDCIEPPHVHVERDNQECKFWLEPLALARNVGFGARELGLIRRLIGKHRERILESWHAHPGQD